MRQNSPPPPERLDEETANGGLRPTAVLRSPGVLPRLLRLRDAPRYLGMDKNRFNKEVRPWLTLIPIGIQGKAFDRLDLDAWVEEHKRRNGRPAARSERKKLWDTRNHQASPYVGRSGTSIKTSAEDAFARALERTISGKRSQSSRDGWSK